MDHLPPAQRDPNGDLLIPASTAQFLRHVLDRLEQELSQFQGQERAAPAEMESSVETAHRQDFVDKLSASVGVQAPTVEARQLPPTSYMADNSASVELLQTLRRLLF